MCHFDYKCAKTVTKREDGVKMIEQVLSWYEKNQAEIDHVYRILQERLSDEPEAMIEQVKDCEAWKARMGYLLAEATTWLERASHFFMPVGEKKEFERRAELKDKVAEIREIKEKIEALVDSIDSRISAVQSNLKYESQKSTPQPLEPATAMRPIRRPY